MRHKKADDRGPAGRSAADDGGSGAREASDGDDLVARLSTLARTLEFQDDLDATLHSIVGAAVDTVPGAEHASISVVLRRREVHTPAATGDLPREVDRAQYETGEGPCLDTLFTQTTARVGDLEADERWPDFAKRAADLGIASMLAVRLFVRGDDLGGLNLFSSRVDGFGDESEHVALLFASHAAVAMAGATEQDQLRTALSSRDEIGMAKGMLMERHQLSGDQAFQVLVHVSQESNRRLVDIAQHLVTNGSLPT